MTVQELHLALGSRFENVELAQAAVDEVIAAHGVDEEARHWVGLAVREAIANAIQHGNRLDASKRVDVAMRFSGGVVEVEVADEGEGFAPEAVRDPLAPENLLRTNGRGIFYMRRFMDDVVYGSTAAGGTRVVLRRRIVDRLEGSQER